MNLNPSIQCLGLKLVLNHILSFILKTFILMYTFLKLSQKYSQFFFKNLISWALVLE
jgi:hypothetical protein